MPTVARTWFETNFGRSPWDHMPVDTAPQTDLLGRPLPQWGTAHPYDVSPGYLEDAYGRPRFDNNVVQGWTQANEAMAKRDTARASASEKAATQAQVQQAQLRMRMRLAMAKARNDQIVVDDSRLNAPTKDQVAAAQASGGDYITTSGLAKDLGRNLTSADVFPTGKYQSQTQAITNDHPRNKYEVALGGEVLGQQTVKTPIVVSPLYKDGAGQALRYAQQKRLGAQDIADWQAFFAARGMIKPGGAIRGAWDDATQKAMYQFMGEANSMGQNVDALRNMWLQAWKQGSPGPSSYAGGGGGSGGGVPSSTTQRVVNITSLAKGGEILRAYLQQVLGRDPDQAEIAAYVRMLNGQERKNPTIVTTSYSASGRSSSSVTKEGNVDQGATAHDYVAQGLGEELKGRQTMKYLDALMGM